MGSIRVTTAAESRCSTSTCSSSESPGGTATEGTKPKDGVRFEKVSFKYPGSHEYAIERMNAIRLGTFSFHFNLFAGSSQLDAWIAIAADGNVTAYTGKCELGHGLYTAQMQLIAEELAVPFNRVMLIQCDTALTPDQGTTSGAQSHPTNFNQGNLALAGAVAGKVDCADRQVVLTVVEGREGRVRAQRLRHGHEDRRGALGRADAEAHECHRDRAALSREVVRAPRWGPTGWSSPSERARARAARSTQ